MEDKRETIVVNKEPAETPEEPVSVSEEQTVYDHITYTDVMPAADLDALLKASGDCAESTEDEGGEASEEDAAAEVTAEQTAEQPEEQSEKQPEEQPAEETDGEDAEEIKKTRYGLPADHPETEALAVKMEERRLYKDRKKRRSRTRFYVILTTIIVAGGCLIFSLSGFFMVDSIEVRGNSHYTAEEIINMGHAAPGRNLLYKPNKKEITEYLLQNPYIKEAEVSRRLPSTLVIKVTERTEKMAFRYDDDYLIMDEEGILLKKTRNAPKTTLIEGIVVNKIKLGQKIGAEDNRNLDKALNIVRTMSASDLYFVKIDIGDESKVKAYVYDTLAVKTDYDTLIDNMKNGRLHLVLEKLFSEGIERGTITFEEDGSASFMPVI